MVKKNTIINITVPFSVLWPFLFVVIAYNIPVGNTGILYLAGVPFAFCSVVFLYLSFSICKSKKITKKEIARKIFFMVIILLGLFLQYWLVFGLWDR